MTCGAADTLPDELLHEGKQAAKREVDVTVEERESFNSHKDAQNSVSTIQDDPFSREHEKTC